METKRYGIEVLHWAGMKDEFLPELQEILISHPQFLNFENKYGENAIHIASRLNNVEIVKWLIENTEINYQKTLDKGNALLIAIENHSLNVANYLFDSTDIDYKALTKEGKGIYHLLVRYGNDYLIDKVLEKYPEGINVLDNNLENCLFDFIVYYSQHKKAYLFDILQDQMNPAIFKTINKHKENLLAFTLSYINDSSSKIELLLKKELLSSLLSQLEFYLGNQ